MPEPTASLVLSPRSLLFAAALFMGGSVGGGGVTWMTKDESSSELRELRDAVIRIEVKVEGIEDKVAKLERKIDL